MSRKSPTPVDGELYLAFVSGRGWAFLTHDPTERWWYAGEDVVFPDRWFSASKNPPSAELAGEFVSRIESAMGEVEFDWHLSCSWHGVIFRFEKTVGGVRKGMHHEIPWPLVGNERGDLVKHEVACIIEKFRRGL